MSSFVQRVLSFLFLSAQMLFVVASPLPLRGGALVNGSKKEEEKENVIGHLDADGVANRRNMFLKSLMGKERSRLFGVRGDEPSLESLVEEVTKAVATKRKDESAKRSKRKRRNLLTDLIAPHMEW